MSFWPARAGTVRRWALALLSPYAAVSSSGLCLWWELLMLCVDCSGLLMVSSSQPFCQ